MSVNIFEQASIKKVRFQSVKGELTVEQLWDLPLQSRNQFDLDNIAKAISRELNVVAEESFVSTQENAVKDALTLKLDIVKHIIAVKIQARDEAAIRAAKAAEKEKLLRLLGEKQDEALRTLTPEELIRRINELS